MIDPSGPDQPADLTVAGLLSLPTFVGAEVVAGASGLGRLVRHVTVVAGTEVTRWVKPAALVIASGHPFQGDSGLMLESLPRELDERGSACMAVRLGSYRASLPEGMLACAEEYGFPLIQLTDSFAFDDIVIDVMSRLNERLAADLVLADRVHEALADLLLRGGGVREISGEVGRLIRADVHFAAGSTATDLDALVGQGYTQVGVGWGAGDPRRLPRESNKVILRVGSQATEVGLLICRREGARFSAAELRALERAATVTALALSQRAAVREVELGFRGDTLARVLRGEVAEHEAQVMFQDLGWLSRGPFQVAVVSAPHERDRDGRLARWLRSAAVDLAEERLSSHQAAVAMMGADVVMVTSASEEPAVQDALRSLLAAAHRHLDPSAGAVSGVGLSTEVAGFRDLNRAYREAVVGARHAVQTFPDGAVVRYDSLGPLGVLLMAAGDRPLVELARRTLAPVLGLPEREGAELIKTLAALIRANLRQAEAARLVPCHYNTLRHRVVKLEELLGPFTRDADTWVNVCLSMSLLNSSTGDPVVRT